MKKLLIIILLPLFTFSQVDTTCYKPVDTLYQKSKGKYLKAYKYKTDTHWYLRYEEIPKKKIDSLKLLFDLRRKKIRNKIQIKSF